MIDNPRAMKMKFLKNQMGTTFVELMVSAVVSIFVLSGTVYVFTNQDAVLKKENDGTKIRAKGRQAIKTLAQEVRMAGFGLPPATAVPDLTQLEQIRFRANLKPIARTEVQVQGNTDNGILKTSSTIPVKNATGFQNGQKITVYHPGWFRYEDHVISSVSSNSISIQSSNFSSDHDFLFGANAQLITVNKYNDVVIKKDGNQVIRCVDDNACANPTVLVSEVSNLAFNYIGVPGTAPTTKIGITLGLIDPNDPFAAIEFKTDVTLRNLGVKG
jgi:Tfp pilus assembly protein PilW